MHRPSSNWPKAFLALAGIALLSGLWAGLLRMGAAQVWGWPLLQVNLPMSHGPLMVSGFLGTLITLERAVALRKNWAYFGPLLSGIGGLLLVFGLGSAGSLFFLTLGSAGLLAIFVSILRQFRAGYIWIMTGGAACWLAGNLLWLTGRPVYEVVLWWATFLVFTIAGERLELSRIYTHSPAAQRIFYAICLFVGGALVLSQVKPEPGWQFFSLGLLAMTAWLLRFDLAWRTIRKEGLPRYIALCLIGGYFWLGIAGLAGVFLGPQLAGFYYDLFLHALFIGFVFSMLFGHAPIIFPALLRVNLVYSPLFYFPLVLMHGSLILRLWGDLTFNINLRLVAGLLNALAILLFFGLVLITAHRSRKA